MNLKEIIRMLKYETDVEKINNKREEIAVVLPEIRIMFDFDQKNSGHQYNLWYHSLHTVLGLPRGIKDDVLYLAALLHDVGKPSVQQLGKDGEMHYKGHQKASTEVVRGMQIDLTPEERNRLLYYVEHHDDRLPLDDEGIHRAIGGVSEIVFKHLVLLEIADADAHVLLPLVKKRIEVGEALYDKLERLEVTE